MGEIIDRIREIQNPIVSSSNENSKEKDTHNKGYIYDSLVYRYKDAREKLAMFQYMLYKERDLTWYQDLANRDLRRFCQILDEAIGEHD